MDVMTYRCDSAEAAPLLTEILYALASAKANALELFVLEPVFAKPESVISILKKIKKSGKISLFVSSTDFSVDSTESSYIKNKYPVFSFDTEDGTVRFLIKI